MNRSRTIALTLLVLGILPLCLLAQNPKLLKDVNPGAANGGGYLPLLPLRRQRRARWIVTDGGGLHVYDPLNETLTTLGTRARRNRYPLECDHRPTVCRLPQSTARVIYLQSVEPWIH